MTTNRRLRIAVMPGDGIGHEVMDAALAVLDAAVGDAAQFALEYERLEAGAAAYRGSGTAMAEEVFADLERGSWKSEYVGTKPNLESSPLPKFGLSISRVIVPWVWVAGSRMPA